MAKTTSDSTRVIMEDLDSGAAAISEKPSETLSREDRKREDSTTTNENHIVRSSSTCTEMENTAEESLSDSTATDQADSKDSPFTSGDEQETHEKVDNDDDDVRDLRQSIATGMTKVPHKERMKIEEEVHGVRSMGLSNNEEMKPGFHALFLKQFKDELDAIMSGSSKAPYSSLTAAYELCIQKQYSYATNESGNLRLMCLRASLWDTTSACERFLRHLTAMYKYYGEDGLREPLTIDRLDYEERHRSVVCGRDRSGRKPSGKKQSSRSSTTGSRGIYKKGKGGSKRKGSLDSLPDMLALKSGSIQVLPSRDRSGRRVVVLQPGPSVATCQQTQLQVQQSKFKAMFYFLCAIARDDVETQRNGLILILNSSKTGDKYNEQDYDIKLIEQYQELCQSIPVRFGAIHLAFDKGSKQSIPHKICMNVIQSYIMCDKTNISRIRLYDEDGSNDNTKNRLALFGIPTHLIPVTHTGTIKLKEHYGWVKIQEWADKKCKLDPNFSSRFTVIECPGTNDVLFSQGGKYWNGVNRFQRGNLEFMEFLESKIDIYQSTLSWKKKHSILAECVAEFAAAPQSTGKAPRFLETATQIEGVSAPDGCWVELPLTSPLLMQKIRQTLLNHIRRLESSGKRKPASTKAVRAKNKSKNKQDKTQKKKIDEDHTKTIREKEIREANKKRKLVHDSTTVMKNNKLAMATFGNSIASNTQNEPLTNKQSICEFLAHAERIAVSTAAVDLACENYQNSNQRHDCNLNDSIATDEKLVQAIIANDDRLNKEVGELFEMDTFLKDEENDGDRDEIADCLMGCML